VKTWEKHNQLNSLITDVGIARVAGANARKKALVAAKEFERLNKLYEATRTHYKKKWDAMILLAEELGMATPEESKELIGGVT